MKASKKTLQTLSSLIGEEMKEAMSSQCARINHVKHAECHKDDVVVYQTAGTMGVAEIKLHFRFRGAFTTLVKAWQVKEWVPHQQFATCTVLDQNLGFVPTADILVPLICHKSQAEAKVLLPYQIYSKLQLAGKRQQLPTAMFACMAAFLLIALWHYLAYIFGVAITTAFVAFHQPKALYTYRCVAFL